MKRILALMLAVMFSIAGSHAFKPLRHCRVRMTSLFFYQRGVFAHLHMRKGKEHVRKPAGTVY